jgi:hypothetical protein
MFFEDNEKTNLEKCAFKYIFNTDIRGIQECKDRIVEINNTDMQQALSKPYQAEHKLTDEIYKRVLDLIFQKIETSVNGCLVEDLSGVEYLANNYNVKFEEFLGTILFGCFIERKIDLYSWFGSAILIKVAPSKSKSKHNLLLKKI